MKLRLLLLTCLWMTGVTASAQSWTFTPSQVSAAPGASILLDVGIDTGGEELYSFSLYFNVDDSIGQFRIVNADLDADWSYLLDPPAMPEVVPDRPDQSQDYGLAIANDGPLPAGIYHLTTLTLAIDPAAFFGDYTFSTGISSIFVDGSMQEFTPAFGEVMLSVVPEPSAVWLLACGCVPFLRRRRRRGNVVLAKS